MSDLLTVALDAHGGLERWRRVRSITATVTVGGHLFAVKGYTGGLGTLQVTAETTVPRVTYAPFVGAAVGVFETDRVAITATDGAQRQRSNPREAISGLAPDTAWDDLDLLYFTGYAMWNYLCEPLVLTWPEVQCDEIEPWTENALRSRRLRVTFPPGLPTHNAEQIVYIDSAGLICRLDYAPDVLGSPPVALYSDGHEDVGGLIVATRRRVYPRRGDGQPQTDLPLVEIDLAEVAVS